MDRGCKEYSKYVTFETDPVFYMDDDGVYTTGGTDYYEFRCTDKKNIRRKKRNKLVFLFYA